MNSVWPGSLCRRPVREEFHREHHVFDDRRKIKESASLEKDSYVLTKLHLLLVGHLREFHISIAYVSAVRLHQTYEVLQQHCLTRTAGTYDHVALALLVFYIYVLQDLHPVEALVQILYLDHFNKALTGLLSGRPEESGCWSRQWPLCWNVLRRESLPWHSIR